MWLKPAIGRITVRVRIKVRVKTGLVLCFVVFEFSQFHILSFLYEYVNTSKDDKVEITR